MQSEIFPLTSKEQIFHSLQVCGPSIFPRSRLASFALGHLAFDIDFSIRTLVVRVLLLDQEQRKNICTIFRDSRAIFSPRGFRID